MMEPRRDGWGSIFPYPPFCCSSSIHLFSLSFFFFLCFLFFEKRDTCINKNISRPSRSYGSSNFIIDYVATGYYIPPSAILKQNLGILPRFAFTLFQTSLLYLEYQNIISHFKWNTNIFQFLNSRYRKISISSFKEATRVSHDLDLNT